MTDETFTIRAYGKSELAMMYLQHLSPDTAAKQFREWLKTNPRLKKYVNKKTKYFTPRQVSRIVEELGEPFDIV